MADILAPSVNPDGQRPSAETIPCPECGYSIEYFSDEESRHCPQCGFKHFRGTVSERDSE